MCLEVEKSPIKIRLQHYQCVMSLRADHAWQSGMASPFPPDKDRSVRFDATHEGEEWTILNYHWSKAISQGFFCLLNVPTDDLQMSSNATLSCRCFLTVFAGVVRAWRYPSKCCQVESVLSFLISVKLLGRHSVSPRANPLLILAGHKFTCENQWRPIDPRAHEPVVSSQVTFYICR